MRNRKTVFAVLLASAASWCSTGCIDGVEVGFQDGVESAISTAIETIVTNALDPIVNRGEGGGE